MHSNLDITSHHISRSAAGKLYLALSPVFPANKLNKLWYSKSRPATKSVKPILEIKAINAMHTNLANMNHYCHIKHHFRQHTCIHDTNTGLDLRLYWLAQGRHRNGVARHGKAPAHGAEAGPCSTSPGWPGLAGPPPTGRRPYLARPALGGWALQGPRPQGGGHASLSQPGFMLTNGDNMQYPQGETEMVPSGSWRRSRGGGG